MAAAGGALTVRRLQRPNQGLRLDLGAIRPLTHFGLRASILKAATLARGLLFVTLVAAIGGTAMAGFYGMATRLFAFPAALASAVQRVSFPALSRTPQERPARTARAAALSATLASLALAVLAGASHTTVTVLLGERWLPTVDLVLAASPGMLLAASAIPAMVGLALSEGRPGGPIAAVTGSAALIAGICVVAIPSLGTVAVGIALSASAVVSTAVLTLRAELQMRSATAPVARALAVGAVAAAAGYLVPVPETALGLAAQLALTAAAWTGLAALAMRPDLLAALRAASPLVPPPLRRLVARSRDPRL